MLDRRDNRCERLLLDWLKARLTPDTTNWLAETARQGLELDDNGLERALGLAGRKAGKAALAPTDTELAQARAARPGWTPRHWTLANAAHAYILLVLALRGDGIGARFRRLCQTADLASLIGLYRATVLLAYDTDFDWQLGEGLRTSVEAIFEAIAHDNPVPMEQFTEHRWNHMVLKALFVGASLPPIMGLDQRRNAALAATLIDHVHERRAAGRAVDLHVWRCIAPFAHGKTLDEIAPLANSTVRVEREAAALFLSESPDIAAVALLDAMTNERDAIASGRLSWAAIAG